MLGVVKMLGRVLIFRRIAAADMPADQAHAQVNPGVANLHAFFADVLVGCPNFDLIKVGALLWHRFLLASLMEF